MEAKLKQRLERKIEMAQTQLDEFQASFAKNPAHALVWSTGTFKAAAERKTLKIMLQDLDNGADVPSLRLMLQNKVLHAAKYPAQSTSPTSNLMEQYELAACAEMLSDLNSLLDK
jgi:hypothetical protein